MRSTSAMKYGRIHRMTTKNELQLQQITTRTHQMHQQFGATTATTKTTKRQKNNQHSLCRRLPMRLWRLTEFRLWSADDWIVLKSDPTASSGGGARCIIAASVPLRECEWCLDSLVLSKLAFPSSSSRMGRIVRRNTWTSGRPGLGLKHRKPNGRATTVTLDGDWSDDDGGGGSGRGSEGPWDSTNGLTRIRKYAWIDDVLQLNSLAGVGKQFANMGER